MSLALERHTRARAPEYVEHLILFATVMSLELEHHTKARTQHQGLSAKRINQEIKLINQHVSGQHSSARRALERQTPAQNTYKYSLSEVRRDNIELYRNKPQSLGF